MSYRTIVVHLDAAARRSERLALAGELALRHDAHLVGLFALPDMRLPYAVGGTSGAIALAEERGRHDGAEAAKEEFQAFTRRNGVKSEWRRSTRDAAAALALSARYADLLIVGQHDPDAKADPERMPRYFVEDTVLSAGRPVLVVPYVGRYPRVGARVLVAWNASREAARAVRDALPLLRGARAVEVVAFNPDTGADHGDEPGADIALYLARHGVNASAAKQHAGIDAGAQILSRAADFSADLVVMGAYGHWRARELVLGGATRTVLQSMTTPVLMAH